MPLLQTLKLDTQVPEGFRAGLIFFQQVLTGQIERPGLLERLSCHVPTRFRLGHTFRITFTCWN